MERDQKLELAWSELHQASISLYGELSRQLETEAAMSAAEHELLWFLARADGRRLTMSDVAERLLVTRSGATRLVDRLERRGWVRRESTPDNRRSTFAVLTTAGARAVRRSEAVIRATRPGLFDAQLTDTDVGDLVRVLGKLRRSLEIVKAG